MAKMAHIYFGIINWMITKYVITIEQKPNPCVRPYDGLPSIGRARERSYKISIVACIAFDAFVIKIDARANGTYLFSFIRSK